MTNPVNLFCHWRDVALVLETDLRKYFICIYCLQFFRKINGSGDIKIDYEHKWLIHIFLTFGSVKEIGKSRKEFFLYNKSYRIPKKISVFYQKKYFDFYCRCHSQICKYVSKGNFFYFILLEMDQKRFTSIRNV